MSAPRARISIAALRNNLDRLRAVAGGARVMAVVKANAYGHGLAAVAQNLAGADAFAVARLGDAVSVAESGSGRPVVLLGGVYRRGDLERVVALGIQPVVHCPEQLELLEAAAAGPAVVWLKVDTGMRRLGFLPSECSEVLRRLRACRGVGELKVMTHLANADDRRDSRTAEQLDAFRAVIEAFDGEISIANSAGLFGWPDSIACGLAPQRSWVRGGLALYGVSPFPGTTGADFGLRPVMRFESELVSIKRARAGDRVGYGGTWAAPGDTVIGIIAAGYGDGYSRLLPSGAPVLVNGRRVPLAGLVSMDLAAVDLGPQANDAIGDPVTLWGDGLPVEEVAASAGTVPYTLLCGVSAERMVERAVAISS